MKKILFILGIGISIVFIAVLTRKELPISDSQKGISVLQSLENTANLQQEIRYQLAGKKDALSVIATSDNTIFCIYTDKQTELYTNYLVVSEFDPETNSFDILSYHDLDLGYESLTLPSEIKKLLDQQVDVTIEGNIHIINDLD